MTTESGPQAWTIGPWPFDATTLMLTLHSAHRTDFHLDDDSANELLDEWADATASNPFQRLRTSAVGPAVAEILMAHGFVVRQELEFLVLSLASTRLASENTPRRGGRSWRVGRIRPADAVHIDVAAFGDEWALDETAFFASCRATQHAQVRGVRTRSALPLTRPVGYCLTGISDDSSYLQRLAVIPTAQRQGAAAVLLADAIDWAHAGGARRMFVNTDVNNAAALSLYGRWGFESVGYRLRVMECARAVLTARRGAR